MEARKTQLGPIEDGASPELRLVKLDGGSSGQSARALWRRPWDSFFVRFLAGTLLVSLPVVAILSLVTFEQGLQTITDAATARTQATAEAASIRIGAWLGERKAELRAIAQDATNRIGQSGVNAIVVRPPNADPAFDAIEIVNPAGKIMSATGVDSYLQGASIVTLKNSLTIESIQPIRQIDTGLLWLMTAPIIGSDGHTQGVVAGDLKVAALGVLLDPYGRVAGSAATQEVHMANGDGLVVYSTDWGALSTDAEIVAKGSLKLKASAYVVNQALDAGPGWARVRDFRGRDVLAGYSPVASLGWVVISSNDAAAALAPVYAQQRSNSLIEAVGVLLMIALAVVLSRITIMPILALSRAAARVEAGDLGARARLTGGGEMRHLGLAFNAMVDQLAGVLTRLRGEVTESARRLSLAAEQLAAATFEQTTAATATSASMEQLARSTVEVANDVDQVATRAAEVRANIDLAQGDLHASGARTVALAARVNEIEGILGAINHIADQTNLLALNAAIEAARAGDAGRGFAVVADEVRRLADRSKAAAAQIAKLAEGTQKESSETIVALDKGVQQMGRGRLLLEAMIEVSDKVQLATQQQRSSTVDVLAAIEHIAEGSRAVAATAQEIASAAARQGELASELATAGWDRRGGTDSGG